MRTASRLTQAELLEVMSLQVRIDERKKSKAEAAESVAEDGPEDAEVVE